MIYVNEYQLQCANPNYPCLCNAMKGSGTKYLCVKIRDGFTLVHDNANKWFLTKNNEIVAMQYAQKSGIYGVTLKSREAVFRLCFNTQFFVYKCKT